jgi:hypothetical protein
MTAPTTTPALRIIQRCEGNIYYRDAVATPAWSDAVALRDKLMHKRTTLQAPIRPQSPPITADVDTWLDGWLDDVARTDESERTRAAKLAALDSLITRCDLEIQAVQHNPNPVLAKLGRDMDGLMTGDIASSVRLLNGAHTPAAVVTAGDPDALGAWQELASLRDEYDKIRQAQDWTTANDHRFQNWKSEYLDDDLASDLSIANLDEIFPAWRRPAAAVTRWDGPNPRPWPTDPVAQLVWLATSGAKVWVPTLVQLGELRDQRLHAARHPNGEPQPQPQAQRQVLNNAPRSSYDPLVEKPWTPDVDDEMQDDDAPDDPDHDNQFSRVPDLGALVTGRPTNE